MKTLDITIKEAKVLMTYKEDDFVSDFGWENERAGTWVKDFHKDCGMRGKEFSGVLASLVKKGIVETNGESFGLTAYGIDVLRALIHAKESVVLISKKGEK